MTSAARDPWLWGLLATVLVTSGLSLPALRYDGDANAWEMEAESLVHRGRLAVRASVAESLPPSAPYFVFNRNTGRWHSKYGIGNTVIYALPLAFERYVLGITDLDPPGTIFGKTSGPYATTRRLILFNTFNLLLTLWLASALYRLARLYTPHCATAVFFALACLYATYLWNYTRAHSSQIYQVLFFSLAMLHLVRFARHAQPRNLLCATLCLVSLCAVKLVFLPLLAVTALGVVLIGWTVRENPLAHISQNLRANLPTYLAYACIPIATLLAVLLWVNDVKFGSALNLGYERETNLFSGSLLASIPAYLFRPRFSIFIHFPLMVVALFGLRDFWRRHAWEVAVPWACFLTMFLLYANYTYWMGEASYGPRYLLFGLPVIALPAVAVLDALRGAVGSWPRRTAAVALLLLLATSAYAQVLVNRLEFHTFFRLRTQFLSAQRNDPELVAYLRDENTALFNRDLIRFRDGGEPPFALTHLASELDPERYRNLEDAVRAHLASNHLFF
ncbi:MAG: hypothetical protein GY944_27845 [bacterium]|nr:hypothetical protein [bacterium]